MRSKLLDSTARDIGLQFKIKCHTTRLELGLFGISRDEIHDGSPCVAKLLLGD